MFVPPRTAPATAPKLTPVSKSPRPVSTAGSDKVEDSATAAVRANLQSVLSTIKQLAARLDSWSPESGTFTDGGEFLAYE